MSHTLGQIYPSSLSSQQQQPLLEQNERDTEMSRTDYLAAVYWSIRNGGHEQVRRSCMMHNTIQIMDNRENPETGRIYSEEIVWMTDDHVYLHAVRHNIKERICDNNKVQTLRLTNTIVLRGIHKTIVMAICDLLWREFTHHLDQFQIYNEDGTPVTEAIPYPSIDANDMEAVVVESPLESRRSPQMSSGRGGGGVTDALLSVFNNATGRGKGAKDE